MILDIKNIIFTNMGKNNNKGNRYGVAINNESRCQDVKEAGGIEYATRKK